MNVEEARSRCREFIKMRMMRHHAKAALKREGFDNQTIQEALEDYDALRAAGEKRRRRLAQAGAGLLFLCCSGAFFYFAFLLPDRNEIHYWSLVLAAIGLLKMLVP